MIASDGRMRPQNRWLRRAAAVAVVVGVAACNRRGVVGVTGSKDLRRDATTTGSDGARSVDAEVRSDARAPGLVSIDDCLPTNPANLSPYLAKQVSDTTGDASGMRFLYPYDGTVYPQGIPGPVVMWDGPPSDAVYVRLHSSTFDYRGCLKATGPNRLDLPSGVWDLVVQSTAGAADPYVLDLKLLSGEAVYGPISERLVVARGALKGSVYYMTTASPAAVGGVLRIRAGRPAEAVLTPPSCAGCHAVSANGARLLAFSSGVGGSFTLSASSSLPQPAAAAPGAEFAGVYPDGSVYVASAHPGGGGPRSYGGGVTNAALYDAATGTVINDSGIPTGACMPAFSPDGRQLAFTDLGVTAGHTLASMQFSIATRSASAYRTLYSAETQFVGWPAFLPDGNAVVFAQGDASDFSGNNAGLIPVITGPRTDLFVVDVATNGATLLLAAMGFRSATDLESGLTYLPGGAQDVHQNYYPSVSPAATGGYAWVLFDSLRTYGNQGAHRAVWGTALTLSNDGTYRTDPSHPAFYLPGQGANTPNFRAVAVLDP